MIKCKMTALLAAISLFVCGVGMSARAESVNKELMMNPVLWADVPDPDVIRVGDYYYMVTTTMHMMPGAPIMRSTNLADWETIGYIFDELNDTPASRLEGGTIYGKGQWATSLRYHDGMFYALFSPNDYPFQSYIYRAADPAGKWELVSRSNHFHDASLLFDDDGRVYVFSGSGRINLRELEPDLSGVKEGGIDTCVVVPQDEYAQALHEGSRVVKHNGKYYLMIISWPRTGRCQLCYRADKITGPYERMVVLNSPFAGFDPVAQGCIVDDSEGNWWGVIFQDRGGVGRVLTLMPCRWVDGWPMLGDENGQVPEVMAKPAPGDPKEIVMSDDFDAPTPGLHWQWNHCPDNEHWSLTDKPGHLRLSTSKVCSNIFEAPNTITQRMEGPECEAEVKIDISKMKDGDVAGFGVFNGHSALLAVKKTGNKCVLSLDECTVNFSGDTKKVDSVDETERFSVPLKGKTVYLRIKGDFRKNRDIARFAYSTDGRKWIDIDGEFKMRFDYMRLFMGTRFAIFNYATKENGGYIDVDYFHYKRTPNSPETALSAGV